jgi:membrane protease YdiL (CAAX protease family)
VKAALNVANSFDAENHLLEQARQAVRLPNALAAVVVAVALLLLAQAIGALLFVAVGSLLLVPARPDVSGAPAPPHLSGLRLSALLISSFLPLYFLLALWVKRFERRPFRTLGYDLPRPAKAYLRGMLVGLLMLSGAVVLLFLTGTAGPESGTGDLQGSQALGGVMLVLVGWVVQGGGEELLCRGWLLPVIGARHRLWLGIVVSSLFFGLAHALNPNVTPIALANLALYGLFAALYALREGSIWGISAQHAVWNWAQANLYGFEVSGMGSSGGSLFNLMETGPDELTGGAFGPEGGLAVTAVLVVAITGLWFRPNLARNRPAEQPPGPV